MENRNAESARKGELVMELRAYQHNAIERVLDRFAAGDQRTLLVVPTGGGKTVIFGYLAKLFIEKKMGRVLVMVHREELMKQAADKMKTLTGVEADIEKAERWSTETGFAEHKSPLVIASVQTLMSGKVGAKRMNRFAPNDFALLILDEAHHAPANTFTTAINYFCQNAKLKFLGVTATPDRKDGEAMGQIFQSVAYEYTLPQIIADGYLVPIKQRRVFIDGLDFSLCRTTAGDVNQGDLEEAMLFEAPLHGVAHATIEVACRLPKDSLRQHAEAVEAGVPPPELLDGITPRRTLIFATSVTHAVRLAEIISRWLKDAADVIHGDMLPEDRTDVLQRFESGEIQFLVGCMVPTEGFDSPSTELIVMARPTKSRALYSQMLGRGTRPAFEIAGKLGELETPEERREMIADSKKPWMEVLDFVGNSGKHDLVCSADILGVTFDPAVVEAARDAAAKGPVDMTEALAKAQEDFEEKKRNAEARRKKEEEDRKLALAAEAAKRANLKGLANYEISDIESADFRTGPGILNVGEKQIKVDVGEADDGTDKITASQLAWLRDKAKLKPHNLQRIASMGRRAAGALMAEVKRGWDNGLRTANQLMILERGGCPKDVFKNMKFEDASAAIDEMAKNNWRYTP